MSRLTYTASPDLFAQARDMFRVSDLWEKFGFEGKPSSSCKSPFREDRSPSFSIFDDGKAWLDHATGEGGDVVEFLRHTLGTDHRGVREWLAVYLSHGSAPLQPSARPKTPKATTAPTVTSKQIDWPAEIREGTADDLREFCDVRGICYPAAWAMTQAGILRFCEIKNSLCYVVTDADHRAAEIRNLGGDLFHERKAYPLRGVNKSWLPGVALLREAPKETSLLLTEGATDLLAAFDLYARYRRNHSGGESWLAATLLGAKCKTLHPEASDLIRGRHVRIIPDGDLAGEDMADHWTGLLRKIGCTVDVVTLPPKTDLSDHFKTISPSVIFSR